MYLFCYRSYNVFYVFQELQHILCFSGVEVYFEAFQKIESILCVSGITIYFMCLKSYCVVFVFPGMQSINVSGQEEWAADLQEYAVIKNTHHMAGLYILVNLASLSV